MKTLPELTDEELTLAVCQSRQDDFIERCKAELHTLKDLQTVLYCTIRTRRRECFQLLLQHFNPSLTEIFAAYTSIIPMPFQHVIVDYCKTVSATEIFQLLNDVLLPTELRSRLIKESLSRGLTLEHFRLLIQSISKFYITEQLLMYKRFTKLRLFQVDDKLQIQHFLDTLPEVCDSAQIQAVLKLVEKCATELTPEQWTSVISSLSTIQHGLGAAIHLMCKHPQPYSADSPGVAAARRALFDAGYAYNQHYAYFKRLDSSFAKTLRRGSVPAQEYLVYAAFVVSSNAITDLGLHSTSTATLHLANLSASYAEYRILLTKPSIQTALSLFPDMSREEVCALIRTIHPLTRL